MAGSRGYDSTVARIAGNILSGHSLNESSDSDRKAVWIAVRMARWIVEEVKATEPKPAEEVKP